MKDPNLKNLYVVCKNGENREKTKNSKGKNPFTWNEKFNINEDEIQL